ncbi:MAG: DNA polymerase III subunit alpha, partial [Clostridia bacterium]|nr:DNA polymerase III subunit alpha [Clostridia bacterium]
IKPLIRRAKEMGMPAVAITDHGVMYGVIDFYKEAIRAGIKPIIGCEVYVAPRSRFDKEAKVDDTPAHLVLLAETDEGYQNLSKLVSRAFLEGFYYKPRVDRALLRQYSKGLIALSGCLAGEIPRSLLKGQADKAKTIAREYKDIFGKDNFFLEVQQHGIEEQTKINYEIIKMARELDIPLVATNDVHYVNKEEAAAQDVLVCIQTGKLREEENRMRFPTEEFYLKSYEEMEMLFGEYPDVLTNTLTIADRCSVNFEFGQLYLPNYQVPTGYTIKSYLRELCLKGAEKRYSILTEEINKRLYYELDVIEKMGFPGYFLIVWDLVNFAKQKHIMVGPGRGSAAGSLVAYCLGITDLDPLKYDLLFERFLNPERVTMPDIDIDFCFERRGEVIEYLVEKYGDDRVAQIITFGTMAAKAAVRDVGRVLNMPYADVDRVAKLIPGELGMTIDKALELNRELKNLYQEDHRVQELLDLARQLEGMPRHASTHAAGVVISQKELIEHLPVQKTADSAVTTQFAKETVEEIGLLKMDILGLRTLTVIRDCLENIRKNKKMDFDPNDFPLNDAKTYELLSRGEGTGVFQLESSGM